MTRQSTSAGPASPTPTDESTREQNAAAHDRSTAGCRPETAEQAMIRDEPAATDGPAETTDTSVTSSDDAPISVTMVSTPGDGSCGIGTYARDLLEAYEAGEARTLPIGQDRRTVGHFVALALRALASGGDVIHVQHEYGLFRRTGSSYPGVMGLVFFPVLLLGNLLARKSVVVTMHSVLTPSPAEAPFRVRLYLQVMHRLIAAASDHLIFLSPDCETGFHEDVHPDRPPYSVLPHGVNVGEASDVDRATAKERLGFAASDRVVAIPGFLRPPKGHDVFVEVARQLPDVEFLIAGGARPKGEDFSFARTIERDAPSNVTITGVMADDEFPVTLAATDLALLPYRVVTQSGTFNWCAAQELPVLASDVSYFQRIAEEWGALETTSIEDPVAIADRVRALLEDPGRRATLSENVRRYKAANSFERVAEDHSRIYRSLLAPADDAPVAGSSVDEAVTRTVAPTRAACAAQRDATASTD